MRRVLLTGCCLLTMGAIWAQAPVVVRPVPQTAVQKAVTGAPFSAVAVRTTTQTLEDGNRIVRTTRTNDYRDSQGRERTEPQPSASVLGEPVTLARVIIADPVAGVTYNLNPKLSTAVQMQRVNFTMGNAGVVFRPVPGATKVTEDLAPQTIEGVFATGTRTTTTIPAGQVGNEKDLSVVDETWYSPDLQMNVKTRHYDPRSGETLYTLTQISRTEPDASLFQVPAGYSTAPQRPATIIVGNPDFKNGTAYILEPPK